MTNPRRRLSRSLAPALLSALVLLMCAASSALADHTQQSIFQDDQYLVYSPTKTVEQTLLALKLIGIDQVRVNVNWANIAPGADSRRMPANFNGALPASYPAAAWAPYDRLVALAQLLRIGVNFNITAPGPLWAMGAHPLSVRAANHWEPNPIDYLAFVYALGVRYGGHYGNIPAVRSWSIWNEPDQPGWLAPQSVRVGGREVAVAPRMYRSYVNAGYLGLDFSGHGSSQDTILIGELAPEGDAKAGAYSPSTPIPFLRDLYCVGSDYRPLTGATATAQGCPSGGSHQAFVTANPGLFKATGFAHHPYFFFHAPSYSSPDQNFVPLENLGRLERGLNRSLGAWGVHRTLPIYLTEYGYQTKPPDPYQTVSPAEQAAYLNEADYIAWRDPRVRSVAQFLLYDSGPDRRYPKGNFNYWDTFQTGLLYANGKPKPAYTAYQTPVWITDTNSRGSKVSLWGQLRAAPIGTAPHAEIQWRGTTGSWRTLSTITVRGAEHYFTTRVGLPGSGTVRIAWASSPKQTLYSRSVAVKRT